MALFATFFEYSCGGCNQFLCHDADFEAVTRFFENTYIFVDADLIGNRAQIDYTPRGNVISCGTCRRHLGVKVFLAFFGRRDQLRLSQGFLLRRMVQIFIHSVVDEHENVIRDNYHFTMGKGEWQT